MAIFEMKDIKYEKEDDLERLIAYVCRKSKYKTLNGLLSIGDDMLVNQFLYLQSCSGKRLGTRALHWVLSFDTLGWEREITAIDIYNFANIYFSGLLQDYQSILAIHDNDKNRHVHIVINPVNCKDYRLFHFSREDLKDFLWNMAVSLYIYNGVALVGVSYINEKGDLQRWKPGEYLYGNRYCKELPLRDESGRVTICPYPKGMYVFPNM